MNLLSRLNTQLSHSVHVWRDSVHLPWSVPDERFAPSGSLVVAVALVSLAAAWVMVTV